MSQENFEPMQDDIDRVVGETEKQMQGFPLATDENVNEAMAEVAAQFGEKFEPVDPAMQPESVIKKYEAEGWDFIHVFEGAADMSAASNEEGEEKKIVGLGNKFLVFKRKAVES